MTEVSKEEYERRRKLWTAALRSGEYQQIKRQLRSPNGFCCLGVACDVAVKNGLSVRIEEELTLSVPMYRYDGSSAVLPYSVVRWYGLSDVEGGFWEPNDKRSCLYRKNDTDELPFGEIAALIDSKPRNLFEDGTY